MRDFRGAAALLLASMALFGPDPEVARIREIEERLEELVRAVVMFGTTLSGAELRELFRVDLQARVSAGPSLSYAAARLLLILQAWGNSGQQPVLVLEEMEPASAWRCRVTFLAPGKYRAAADATGEGWETSEPWPTQQAAREDARRMAAQAQRERAEMWRAARGLDDAPMNLDNTLSAGAQARVDEFYRETFAGRTTKIEICDDPYNVVRPQVSAELGPEPITQEYADSVLGTLYERATAPTSSRAEFEHMQRLAMNTAGDRAAARVARQRESQRAFAEAQADLEQRRQAAAETVAPRRFCAPPKPVVIRPPERRVAQDEHRRTRARAKKRRGW